MSQKIHEEITDGPTIATRTGVIIAQTRRITLTDIGRELYPLFSQMIDDLDGALANVADHTSLKKGIVRIAAPQLLSCTLLPEAIAAYRASYPDIVVRLKDTAVEGVIAATTPKGVYSSRVIP